MNKAPTTKTQQLGRILLERNIIDQTQLRHALDVQRENNGSFGEVLSGLGYVEEHDIVAALVVQCHIPYIAIDKYDLDHNVLSLIPAETARKYHVVPLDRVNDIFSVVMSDPLDEGAKAELRRSTRCRLAPFIATDSEIERAIEKWYGKQD